MASPSTYNLLRFHRIEGIVFQRVKRAGRESTVAMNVVALWMWLETMGFRNVIQRAKNATPDVFQRLLREAEAILDCLPQGSPPPSGNKRAVALTAEGVRESISLRFFYHNRDLAIRSMVGILDGVGRIIFNDELIKAAKDIDAGHQLQPNSVSALQAPYVELMEPTSEDHRSILVTFKSGARPTGEGIRDYFSRWWGVGVERVDFDSDGTTEDGGRVVFASPSFLPLVLKGGEYAEFDVGGWLMWGRRNLPVSR